MQGMMQEPKMRELLDRGNSIATLRHMLQAGMRQVEQLALDALPACQGMDLLITGMVSTLIGVALARKLEIPLIQTRLFPMTPTKNFPSLFLPQNLPNLGGAFNRFSSRFFLQATWLPVRPMFNRIAKKVLGLPPLPFGELFHANRPKNIPLLYGFSPSVLPAPADWGDEIHVTGYWFLDPDEAWLPPPALQDFLQAGPTPVYIGFGSMSSRKPEQTADLVIKALLKTNQRALLYSGWGALHKEDLPETIFMIDSTPHAWLFPRMAAVVHHGGAGTTAAGLRAGVPSIVIPFMVDQPFWGQRVQDLGVGPAPIPRSKLNADRLAAAIQEAVKNTGMRQRAAELGAKIRAEDGVATAVEIIQGMEARL
jgi:UDP:flavonoid glycosyltransferase YjiC (YdhE family)